MQINVSYYNNGIPLPAGFTSAINYVVSYFDNLITTNETVNIQVGYGTYDGGHAVNNGGGVENDFNLANGNTTNALLYHYSTVRQALINHGAAGSSTLPVNDPLGSGFDIYVQPSEARALGLAAGTANGNIDAYIGFGQPVAGHPYSFDPNNRAIPGDSDFIGVALHEFSHALGRISEAGTPNEFSLLDLFRYSGAGVRQVGNGVPAYFSTDGGVTDLKGFATSSDQGDWNNSLAGNYVADSANAIYFFNYENDYTSLDQNLLSTIGYNLSPNVAGGGVNGLGAGALVQLGDGSLDYLKFAGTSLVGSQAVNYTSWTIAGQGDFLHNGRTDLVSQDPNSASIDLLFTDGSGNLTGSLLEQGSGYWKVVGTGDFDGSGRTAIATQSAVTGQIDLLWFSGTQLISSALLNGAYQPVVGTTDASGNGITDLVTQSSGGGPLDFLFFNGTNLVSSAQTASSFWQVHDVYNSTGNGQSVMLAQDVGSGQLDYLRFNGTTLTASQLEAGSYAGLTPVLGGQAANQLFFQT